MQKPCGGRARVCDAGLFGECTPVDEVGLGGVSPVVCNVLIAANMAPMSEPSFTLVSTMQGSTTPPRSAPRGAQRTGFVGHRLGPDVHDGTRAPSGGNHQHGNGAATTGGCGRPVFWSVSVDGNDILDLNGTIGFGSLERAGGFQKRNRILATVPEHCSPTKLHFCRIVHREPRERVGPGWIPPLLLRC